MLCGVGLSVGYKQCSGDHPPVSCPDRLCVLCCVVGDVCQKGARECILCEFPLAAFNPFFTKLWGEEVWDRNSLFPLFTNTNDLIYTNRRFFPLVQCSGIW